MRVIKAWINQFLFGGRRTAFDWGIGPVDGSHWATRADYMCQHDPLRPFPDPENDMRPSLHPQSAA